MDQRRKKLLLLMFHHYYWTGVFLICLNMKKNRTNMKKRPRYSLDGDDNSNMEKFISAYQSSLTNLALKFKTEEEAIDDKAKKLIAVLREMENLSAKARCYLTFKIAENPCHISIFLASSPEDQAAQATMLLQGNF